jgi:FixJ family two-component response regulator
MQSQERKPVTVHDQELAHRHACGLVILIDDDPDILRSLQDLFLFEGYACETYLDARDCIADLARDEPRYPGPVCVLSDVNMPAFDGLELQRALAEHPEVVLLMMSGSSQPRQVIEAFRGGVFDFLLKPFDDHQMLDMVSAALRESARRQQTRVRQTGLIQRRLDLTERELEVVRLVARGLMNKQIADRLDIALRTVKLHRQRAIEKLQVDSVIELGRLLDEGIL